MNFRANLFTAFSILIGGLMLLMTACDRKSMSSEHAEKTFYTCGMHPQVVQDHPGNCPICGMKLTPVHKHDVATAAVSTNGRAASQNEQGMALDPVTIQNMGVRTAVVTRGPLRRIVRTVGTVDYNEAGVADVTTKFKGWIEKLYVDTTGQQVHRGEPLFEIYSPELYSAQIEYLLASGTETNAVSGRESLRAAARNKLRFLDISDEQIAELERTREARKTLRILAPMDGFVTEKSVVEGQMVDAGMKLYRLADLSLVWVQAQVYEQDLGFIRLGQEATVSLSYLPDREFRGRVTYLYPNVDEKTRTARVRMEFHNPGYYLKPGMFAQVQAMAELEPSALLIPDMAILRSGEQNTVFVALEGGRFEARNVVLGPQAENDTYQVLAGLTEGERIVTSGQFMLDSESQLREAIQKMQPAGASLAHQLNSTNGLSSSNLLQTNSRSPQLPNDVRYICPMPEHVSIEYEHPGKCPLCGMTLVPVSEAALRKLHPGGKVEYWTCPMPEHSDVHVDKPGKCPKCGMTLIPVMMPPPVRTATQNTPSILYTCPMASHADVVSDKPGKCTKCPMDLVPTSTVPHGNIAEENWRKQHAATPVP